MLGQPIIPRRRKTGAHINDLDQIDRFSRPGAIYISLRPKQVLRNPVRKILIPKLSYRLKTWRKLMIINLNRTQRLSLQKSIQYKTADKHVNIVNLENVLSDFCCEVSVFFVQNIKVDSGLIKTFHVLPSDHESELLVMLPIIWSVEAFVKIRDLLLNLCVFYRVFST